jgi:PAS domain S-box-containing protein
MADEIGAVGWAGPVAVVPSPEHLNASGAAGMGDQIRAALRDGAAVLVADMSATSWCDRAGLDALIRAYQLAAVSQAELRLVVTGAAVGRLVSDAGLDRLVPVFGSVEAAMAAPGPDGNAAPDAAALQAGVLPWPARPQSGQANGSGPAGPNAALLRQLIDTLDDGIMLADDGTIVLASRRLTAMFGYQDGELTGQPVETLVPADRRVEHRQERAAYELAPVSRPMGGRARLAGVRKDGGTLPVTITLSPVATAGGHFVLAVVRDATRLQRWGDLASLVRAAAAEREQRSDALLDRVVSSLLHVGLSLQAAADQPADVARQRITDALARLDDVIHEIRDHLFRSRRSGGGGDSP